MDYDSTSLICSSFLWEELGEGAPIMDSKYESRESFAATLEMGWGITDSRKYTWEEEE